MSAPVAAPDETQSVAVSLIASVTDDLTEFLDSHARMLVGIHPDLAMLADAARGAVLGGGKRLRPSFAYWGWRSALPAGAAGEAHLLRAAASLELLHACALVHDDVMDSSDPRRGQPAAHMRFGTLHRSAGWPGLPATFGTAGAILLGDLLLSWAEEMFTAAISELPAERAVAAEARIIGVNNRNLETLEIEEGTAGALIPQIPRDCIAVAESGYSSRASIERVAGCGADAVLVGSFLSGAVDPERAVQRLTGVRRESGGR